MLYSARSVMTRARRCVLPLRLILSIRLLCATFSETAARSRRGRALRRQRPRLQAAARVAAGASAPAAVPAARRPPLGANSREPLRMGAEARARRRAGGRGGETEPVSGLPRGAKLPGLASARARHPFPAPSGGPPRARRPLPPVRARRGWSDSLLHIMAHRFPGSPGLPGTPGPPASPGRPTCSGQMRPSCPPGGPRGPRCGSGHPLGGGTERAPRARSPADGTRAASSSPWAPQRPQAPAVSRRPGSPWQPPLPMSGLTPSSSWPTWARCSPAGRSSAAAL